jgi:non-reducing end alpha-L-arabinofuranosidase
MDAINFSKECWFAPCSGSGPWVQADLESGLFAGANGSGGLTTWYSGPLPSIGGYAPMHQEGAIVLGTGGDNSKPSAGSFFEGVLTAGYPGDATDSAVQANIASVGYRT